MFGNIYETPGHDRVGYHYSIGTTETGSYNLNGVTGSYFDYPTSSDSAASNDADNPDPGNNANFYQSGYSIGEDFLHASTNRHGTLTAEFDNWGFRIAHVPEPMTVAMLTLATLCVLGGRRRQADRPDLESATNK